MGLISASLKIQYEALSRNAKASIHRHAQMSMADELVYLSRTVTDQDARDSYGHGGVVSDFEQQLSELFGHPDCLFLPTGTLAQCVAIKCHANESKRSQIGLHPTSHLLLHEHMAIERLWGLHVSVMGEHHRVLTLQDVHVLDPEMTAAIIVELPMREIGGALPVWSDLLAIRDWCRCHEIKLHMDGARIWQATKFYQRSLADIASLFDSLYVSFYKDLGGIFGAALLGSPEMIAQARIWSRRAGGNPITQYPEVLAARAGLTQYLNQMPDFVDYTLALTGLVREESAELIPQHPQAAMFHLRFAMNAEALATKIVSYAEQTGIVVLPLPRSGDEHSCVCEVSIGERATAHRPEFWAGHIRACLAQ